LCVRTARGAGPRARAHTRIKKKRVRYARAARAHTRAVLRTRAHVYNSARACAHDRSTAVPGGRPVPGTRRRGAPLAGSRAKSSHHARARAHVRTRAHEIKSARAHARAYARVARTTGQRMRKLTGECACAVLRRACRHVNAALAASLFAAVMRAGTTKSAARSAQAVPPRRRW
jgi:hypothetical protein